MAFKVTDIIDGNTIKVSPGWKWKEVLGDTVKVFGYRQPTTEELEFTKSKLITLIDDKIVELKNPKEINGPTITCSVFLNGIDISQYFPELK
jgi:hypothetical protein